MKEFLSQVFLRGILFGLAIGFMTTYGLKEQCDASGKISLMGDYYECKIIKEQKK